MTLKTEFTLDSIMDYNIVKITHRENRKNTILYQHPYYHIDIEFRKINGYYCLFKEGHKTPIYQSKSKKDTEKERKIYTGEREK